MINYKIIAVLLLSLFLWGCSPTTENIELPPLRNTILNLYVDDSLFQVIGSFEGDTLVFEDPVIPQGYQFVGWSDGNELFNPNDWEYQEKINLYAIFDLVLFNIEFELNEGQLSTEIPNEISIKDTLILPTAVKEGYIFLGWYDNPDFKGRQISVIRESAQDIKLYAKFEKETKLGSFESLMNEIVNIDFKEHSGSFIDHRYYMPPETFWYSRYYGYFADGHIIEFNFLDNHLIYQTVQHAFLYGRVMGWLPERLRTKLDAIEFQRADFHQLTLNDNRTLLINISYDQEFYLSRPVLGPLLDTTLNPFYDSLNDELIHEYQKIVDESYFHISSQASLNYYQDFLESYIYYLMLIHLNDFQENEYEIQMESRFDFFEKIELGIETYEDDTIDEISANMRTDTALFQGTVWDLPIIFEIDDLSALESITYDGMGVRMSYDHRDTPSGYQFRNKYLFTASYNHGHEVEFQISEEFGSLEKAEEIVEVYARTLGQLPSKMFFKLKSYTIFQAPFAAGGGSGNIVVAHDPSDPIIDNPAFVEMVLHEAGHASLDWDHGGLIEKSRWLEAAAADDYFITTYSKIHPLREDVAETISVYLLYRYRYNRADKDLIEMIGRLIPNRIAYFDEFDFSFPE